MRDRVWNKEVVCSPESVISFLNDSGEFQSFGGGLIWAITQKMPNLAGCTPKEIAKHVISLFGDKRIKFNLLLLSKANRIYENLTDVAAEKIYEFSNFLFVLNVGFDNDDMESQAQSKPTLCESSKYHGTGRVLIACGIFLLFPIL